MFGHTHCNTHSNINDSTHCGASHDNQGLAPSMSATITVTAEGSMTALVKSLGAAPIAHIQKHQ